MPALPPRWFHRHTFDCCCWLFALYVVIRRGWPQHHTFSQLEVKAVVARIALVENVENVAENRMCTDENAIVEKEKTEVVGHWLDVSQREAPSVFSGAPAAVSRKGRGREGLLSYADLASEGLLLGQKARCVVYIAKRHPVEHLGVFFAYHLQERGSVDEVEGVFQVDL